MVHENWPKGIARALTMTDCERLHGVWTPHPFLFVHKAFKGLVGVGLGFGEESTLVGSQKESVYVQVSGKIATTCWP